MQCAVVRVQREPVGQNGRDHGVAIGLLVVAALAASVVHDLAAVRGEACDDASDVAVDAECAFVGARNQHLGHLWLLHGKHNAVAAADADSGAGQTGEEEGGSEGDKWIE